MKHFQYLVKETRRNLGREKELHLWIVKKNTPVKIGVFDYSFLSDGQNVLAAVKHFGALKGKDLLPKLSNGMEPSRFEYEKAGIATFHNLGEYK